MPIVVDRYVVQCPVDRSNACGPIFTERSRYIIKAEGTINVTLYRVNLI